jgi:hypothetical protein
MEVFNGNGNKEAEFITKFVEELIEDKTLKGIIKDGTIEGPTISKEILEQFLEKPTPFRFNENGELFFEDNKGGQFIVDPGSSNISELTDEIIQKLPEIGFDIDRNGVKTQQIEAEAIYKCCIINSMLEDEYSNDIKGIIINYNWSTLQTSTGSLGFKNLLSKIQAESSNSVRLIISCINTKIILNTEKNEPIFSTYVNVTAVSELKTLIKRIKVKTADLNSAIEATNDKIERLTLIRKRESISDRLINEADKTGLLYKVTKLTTESVPILLKGKIRRKASKEVQKLISSGYIEDREYARIFESKLIRRASKVALNSLKIRKYKDFEDGKYEGLIPKM